MICVVFSSSVFLFCFLPLVLLINHFLNERHRNGFLLLASLFFYAWGEPLFVFVMMASIGMNYLLGIAIANACDAAIKKRYLLFGTVLNLLMLAVFKYTNFIVANINTLWPGLVPQTQIALPIGISFFTFQAMSYLFDIYRGLSKVQRNPMYVALYISFFPQLIAGPIVRYQDVADQIDRRTVSMNDMAVGIRRFLLGFNKKVLLANSMAVVADKAFSISPDELSASFAWMGIFAYSMQVYFDFSGYSDMAIGLGRMFGFHFLENFNYPYIAKSVSEYWRRWHISLGTWFREYVYFPLGGSRVKTKARLVFNMFVVWMLTGIWHGANWTYVLWGFTYFLLLAMERLLNLPGRFKSRWAQEFYRVFTLISLLLTAPIFRSVSLSASMAYFRNLFTYRAIAPNMLTAIYLREYGAFFLFSVLFSIPIKTVLMQHIQNDRFRMVIECASTVMLFVLFILSIAALATSSYNPFIYFNF